MSSVMMLPQRLDANAAEQLVSELLERRGGSLTLNAGSVETVSALALEVIVSAARQWERDGAMIQMGDVSTSFRATCATLGLNGDQPWVSTEDKGVGR